MKRAVNYSSRVFFLFLTRGSANEAVVPQVQYNTENVEFLRETCKKTRGKKFMGTTQAVTGWHDDLC